MDNKAFIKKHPWLREMWSQYRDLLSQHAFLVSELEDKYNQECQKCKHKGIKTVELFYCDGGVVGIGINHYEKAGKKLIHDSDLGDL